MSKLSPNAGGCWFCHQDNENEQLDFDCEFDTFVHTTCIKKKLEEEPDHPEAIVMKYLIPAKSYN